MPSRRDPPRREIVLLTVILGVAFLARALALWLTRPEFVGWFTHSYYYWVQVRGLLEAGELPYADLPLLFHLYAVGAALLQRFGMELEPAIVTSTRMVMSLVPALIAVPVYGILRAIGGWRPLSRWAWVLVALSAFLPLTYAHIPELLQKNALGLLLLAVLLSISYRLLHRPSRWGWLAAVGVFVLIALTHLGTLAVALLFGVSLFLASLWQRAGWKQVWMGFGLLTLLSMAGLGAVYLLDPEAFGRVLRYVGSSLPGSLLVQLLSSAPTVPRLGLLAGILIPLAALLLLGKGYAKQREALSTPDRVFWLANVFLIYLLVLPIFDLEVLPRLVLFLPLPLLVVLGYLLRYGSRPRAVRLVVALAAVGCALMVFGETMNLVRLYPNKAAIHQELLELKDRHQLTADDFVLTVYGVNPACNWFLGTRSGLITSFRAEDLDAYRRFFVLNPREGRRAPGFSPEAGEGRITYRTGPERYEAMRQLILPPEGAEPLFAGEYLELYEVHTVPETWLFDDRGDWIGYRWERRGRTSEEGGDG